MAPSASLISRRGAALSGQPLQGLLLQLLSARGRPGAAARSMSIRARAFQVLSFPVSPCSQLEFGCLGCSFLAPRAASLAHAAPDAYRLLAPCDRMPLAKPARSTRYTNATYSPPNPTAAATPAHTGAHARRRSVATPSARRRGPSPPPRPCPRRTCPPAGTRLLRPARCTRAGSRAARGPGPIGRHSSMRIVARPEAAAAAAAAARSRPPRRARRRRPASA